MRLMMERSAKLKTRAVTLMKEDVLAQGRLVSATMQELSRILRKNPCGCFDAIVKHEEEINNACKNIEEKCLDFLSEYKDLNQQEIRTLVGSTLIAAKFERLSDHALRVARFVSWVAAEDVQIPEQFAEMSATITRMVDDVLLCFLTDATDRLPEIILRDSQVDYLHDYLSKKLMQDLGTQNQEEAQTTTQLLFCTRYLERMGDACTSIAKRIYFIVTGRRFTVESQGEKPCQ
jgi:phosphate transport system protein